MCLTTLVQAYHVIFKEIFCSLFLFSRHHNFVYGGFMGFSYMRILIEREKLSYILKNTGVKNKNKYK